MRNLLLIIALLASACRTAQAPAFVVPAAKLARCEQVQARLRDAGVVSATDRGNDE
jgi:hypothetical protein